MKSMQILKVGWLLGGKEGMFLSLKSKVQLFTCTDLFRSCLFDFAKEIIFWRITRNLIFFVSLLWHLHQTYFTIDRFKDRDFNIMCASGGWLCSSPTTWSARC